MARPRISSLLQSPSKAYLAMASLVSLSFILFYLFGIHHLSFSPIPPSTPPSLPQGPISSSAAGATGTATAAGASLEVLPRHTNSISTLSPPPLPSIPLCPQNFTHHCPCQDTSRDRLFSTRHFSHRERHCPTPADRLPPCRIPRPSSYRPPIPWPESRRSVWIANVPFKNLTVSKADQNWVIVEGDRFVFPGGGTSFPRGVESYVAQISKVVPLTTGEVRTVLDIGCGVASFGNHLLDYNVLTMSVAPRDVHEAQVQFALERGLSAMLGVLSLYRLPYPSRSFDMAHCARCLLKWAGRGGLYLMEIDRVLRPGGYWVLSGPPINWKNMYKGWKRTPENLEEEQNKVEELAKRLCWKKIAEKAPIAVWRKPTNHVHCATKLKKFNSPLFCERTDPDTAWYYKLQDCLTPLPKVEGIRDTAGGLLSKWPKRLNEVPLRIKSSSVKGLTAEIFNNDNLIWNQRVSNYGSFINFGMAGKHRNILDMNAGLGGFAAALAMYPVWVMNVIPENSLINTLGIIYERGLIGTYMNWCEAFSTYPRTYDLIHAHGIFSMYLGRCELIDILLEMDRIIRPGGTAIIRDRTNIIPKVEDEAERLGWRCRMVQSENNTSHHEKLLVAEITIGKMAYD
ncbi:putative methyltransferase PMT19 [Platanthera zijinensis]|uniref:Methyltransferase n=1 Tax=Platanthera zijinensis TaxID=2320716 RepID=A0AAP0AU04_9ASPA